jgi:hypothetical protein
VILIRMDCDPDVAYDVIATDQDGTVVYAGPAPIWPLGLCQLSLAEMMEGRHFEFDMTPHVRGTPRHHHISLVNAGRAGLN